MKIGVIGANGQLGSELVKLGCVPLAGRLFNDYLKEQIIGGNFDCIINCAAMTDVDRCEIEPDLAMKINAVALDWLSKIVLGGYLVQISTDYIYDGLSGPYMPKDPPNPISIYGWSKLGGELIVRRHKGPWLIVRTTILFGESENNFVSKVVEQLADGSQVKLYQPDLRGSPTYIPALAAEIIRIIEAKYTGVAHIAGDAQMTRLQFAQMIAKAFGFNPDDIIAIDDGYLAYNEPDEPLISRAGAPRPPVAGLICDHDGYQTIISHSMQRGLNELAIKDVL